MHLMTRHLGTASPLLSILAIFTLFSAAGPVAASAAVGPQSLTLSAPQLAGSPGDTLDVAISLSSVIGVTELAAMKFAVRVDTLALEPLDAVRGGQLSAWPASDFHAVVDGDRLSISALTATPQSVGGQPVPIGVGELVRVRFRVRDQALDGRLSPLDITATNDEQSILMLSDAMQALPGIKTVDVDGRVAVTNGFTCVRGDASGDGALGTDDAVITLRFAAGLLSPVPAQVLCGSDANLDHEYNAFDASWILSSVVGVPLPKAVRAATSLRPVASLERRGEAVVLVVDSAESVLSAEFRLLADEGTRFATPASLPGALLVSDRVGDELRGAVAATASLGSRVEIELPLEDAEWVSLVHLRLYGGDGHALAFDVEEPTVEWSRTPAMAASQLALGSYPNPFNPSTTLRMEMPRAGKATLEVFDAAGRKVVVLVNEELAAGVHEIEWTGLDSRGTAVASGVYFARLVSANQQARQRLLLVK